MKTKLWPLFLAHAYSVSAIMICLYLGKAVHWFIGGLPSSLYGMMIFAALLRFGVVYSSRISGCIDIYVKYMLIVYIPAVVGVMEFGELIVSAGWKILVIAVLTTLFGMLLIGLLSQRIFKDQ